MMKMRIDLRGGWAENATPETVRIGDRLVPEAIDVNLHGADGQPALHMRLAVVGGVPQCRELTIRSHADGRAVQAVDLRAVRLVDWVDDVFAMFSQEITSEEDGTVHSVFRVPGTAPHHLGAVAQFRESRKGKGARKIDDQFLRGVADVYREHLTGNPTQAVGRIYDVRERTAAKYVQQARAAGHLGPTTRGRKGA